MVEENNEKKLKEMSKGDLMDLLLEQGGVSGNFISLDGITIQSTTESLAELERTLDRIVKKHKDFLITRKREKVLRGYAG